MPTLWSRATIASMLLVTLQPAIALAQPDGPPSSRAEVRAEPLAGGGAARLTITWADTSDDCSARLTIPGVAPVVLSQGPAAGTLASGPDALLVAEPTQRRTAMTPNEFVEYAEPIYQPTARGSPKPH